jgi:hypothetical protein
VCEQYTAAPDMPSDVSFTDMYKAGMVPDFGGAGSHPATAKQIPQLQADDDQEVYEEYYDDVPGWEPPEDDDDDLEVCTQHLNS